jgi:hypothetical protein
MEKEQSIIWDINDKPEKSLQFISEIVNVNTSSKNNKRTLEKIGGNWDLN